MTSKGEEVMAGPAQRLLIGKIRSFPLTKNGDTSSWPTLEACVEKGLLPYIDYAVAKTLLKEHESSSEALAALICHLSCSARLGHLCISCKGEKLDPDPSMVWPVLQEGAFDVQTDAISNLLEDVYRLVVAGTAEAEGFAAVKRSGPLCYLQKYWVYESWFLQGLKRLMEEPPAVAVDESFVAATAEKMIATGILTPAQAKAAVAAAKHRLTVLTGGPGTGKTYTAGKLLEILWKNLSAEAKEEFNIVLAAPTGKAAMHLQGGIQKMVGTVADFPSVRGMTLHALLGVKSRKDIPDTGEMLAADLVLVDESSMIDVRLMMLLFCSLKPGARLILLGDRWQLPPVEAGSLFADLTRLLEKMEASSLVALTQCLRVEKEELLAFATAIKLGDSAAATRMLKNSSPGHPVARLSFDLKNLHEQLVEYAKPYFNQEMPFEPASLLRQYDRFRLLTPLRKGPCGVEELNRVFEKAFGAAAVPIIVLQNDYRLDLFNGETGVLLKTPSGWQAHFPARGGGEGCRCFPEPLLPNYEAAYCLSVHKSQGSEFDHVVMLVPQRSEFFGREVIYTAATRARQRLDVWGEDSVIEKTLANRACRMSGVVE